LYLGIDPEHDLDICQPEIRVKYNDALSKLLHLHCKVDRYIGFTDTAFSTGDRNDPGIRLMILVFQLYNISKRFLPDP